MIDLFYAPTPNGWKISIFLEDPELDRKTRTAAIEAMREHGVEDYRKLLEGLG
jgi:hypothetical protein